MPDRSYLYRDAIGSYRWKRLAPNHEQVAGSTEAYLSKEHAKENYYRVSGEGAPDLEDLTDVETSED